MAANEYYGGPPPVYPPVPPQQGYGGGYPPQQQGYYSGPAPPAQYTGPDGKPHPFAHYLQQPAPLPPHPQPGFNYPQQYQQPGQVVPYGNSGSRSSSPLPPGADGPQDRGLGSTLIGGIAGSTLAHKMGGGTLGTIAGAVGGAILANVASHKIKDKKKKKKKSKKHGSRRRRGSSGSSESESESDSDSSRSSGGRRAPRGKRYALGYSTGGGSVFGPVAPRKSRRRHSSRSDSD